LLSGIAGLISSVSFLIVLSQKVVSNITQLGIFAMIPISFILGFATLVIATREKNRGGNSDDNFIKWGRGLGIYNIAISVITIAYLLALFLYVLAGLSG
jgi:hypothetical protein